MLVYRYYTQLGSFQRGLTENAKGKIYGFKFKMLLRKSRVWWIQWLQNVFKHHFLLPFAIFRSPGSLLYDQRRTAAATFSQREKILPSSECTLLRVIKLFPKARTGSLFTSELTTNKKNRLIIIITLNLTIFTQGMWDNGLTWTHKHKNKCLCIENCF